MRETMRRLMVAGAAAFLLASPAVAATVEEVIAKNIQARGGVEPWRAIRTLRVTGSMTSWSRKAPFTLLRKGDGKYHLDSIMDGKKVEIGYDGDTAWWDNHWMQEGAQRIRGADLVVLMREVDLPNPFFDYREKGHEVKLLGDAEFEGEKAIGVEVKRADGGVETWYLNPSTFLEFARESPGADFGRPVPQRTFYDDYRSVAGVKMPFRVESQWYTRERIFQVEKVETNVEVDDKLFQMPPPIGMGQFLPLAGVWKVAVSQRDSPQSPWRDSERESKIATLLGGALLQDTFTTGGGHEVVRSISYDKYRKKYRITEINDSSTYLDVQEGDFDDQKKLVVSNTTTGTTSQVFGYSFNTRTTILDITPEGFKIEEEISFDAGKEWMMVAKATYTRLKS